MYTNVITALETQLQNTLTLLDSFTEDEINKIPFEGSWTAAQAGEHLRKAENKTDELLLAKSQPADRQPDEKAEWLRDMFLNFETKMKSPDFIVPESKTYNKQELIGSLLKIKDEIVTAAHKGVLNEMAPLPPQHPLQGMTKLEVVYFITYHAQRHNHQIQKIREAV